MAKTYNVEIRVDENLERSMRQMKKRMEREGVVRDMKRRAYHETPTQKRRKKIMRAIKTNVIKLMMNTFGD